MGIFTSWLNASLEGENEGWKVNWTNQNMVSSQPFYSRKSSLISNNIMEQILHSGISRDFVISCLSHRWITEE